MRVALATYSTKPRGGVVHTLGLAEALARRGHDVTVWTLGRGGDTTFFRPVDPAVRVEAVPFAPVDAEDVGARIVRSIDVLGGALAEHLRSQRARPDVVHAQDCISANAALAPARTAGVPLVRTVHHLDAFTTPQLVACHDAAVREPDALVCVSAAVAGEVRAGYGLQATVIPGAVDAARFAAAARPAPSARAARRAWRSRLGRFVLAVGGVEPRKGSLDLLEAWALLRRHRLDLRNVALVLAGGETLFDHREYRAAFEARAAELAQELGAAPVVLGPVDDDALPSLVAAADAVAFPSTKEGFGMAPLEALAAGVPVVARDLPVLREVLGEAVLFGGGVPDLADALVSALDGGAPSAAHGRVVAAGFGWPRAAAAHEAFYERLPGDGRSRIGA
ncbi:MSMEG_0565 family glycosyltransferase [Streptomyces sp. NP160]|uniref:MSMEG_0565 family glycosyltransferase n=1 Tax=Streptomyces sp. NP160 TaxID=2586637 RepID=UPI00111A7EAC|nr:MSMEG_0565 family glycosyltransferase [Streptomyces sp. NP160]TNM64430.1 MSMEG_0565 family glycosyltransferase [Streptomyces sp. NP160]